MIDLKGKVESQGLSLGYEAGRATHRNLKNVFIPQSEKMPEEMQRRKSQPYETDHDRALMQG